MTASVDAVDSIESKETGNHPPYWLEIGCMSLFFIGLLVTCGGLTLMFWSVTVPYSGHFAMFHIVSIAIILIHGSVTSMIVLHFPFLYAVKRNLSQKKGTTL